jgi:acetaldehyde dehydrogenase (acetylating)
MVLKLAQQKGVTVTDQGINYFIDNPKCCDVVYDCTSAKDAKEHAKIICRTRNKSNRFNPC